MSTIAESHSVSAAAGRPPYLIYWGLLFAALAWCYWATLVGLAREWRLNDDYSAGQLVPLVAAFLIWRDRSELRRLAVVPSPAGLILLFAGLTAQLAGFVWMYESIERYAVIIAAWGVVLTLAGPRITWKLRWVLLFLLLMVPLPGQVHNWISGPLQNLAAAAASFFLELFGVLVSREGNILLLDDITPIAVAEACSGLRMLMAFIIVSVSLALLVNRPAWQRAVLVLSSIPIAVACNTARLVITAMLIRTSDSEFARHFFHDFAGWIMMPAAVAILGAEMWLLPKLVAQEESLRQFATGDSQ